MKLPRIIFLLIGAVISGWAQEPAAATATLGEPGQRLFAGGDDSTWQPLMSALAAKGSIVATFTERRWFSFRNEPVVLTGEIRRSPELGLSLRYLKPEEKMMIVDDRGIVLRNARGWSRQLKPDRRAANSGEMLLQVLRFDWAGLAQDFEVYAARDGEDWRFDFLPLTGEAGGPLGPVTVWGHDEAVTRLAMHPADGPRIEIEIESAREQVTFTPAEVKKFFR